MWGTHTSGEFKRNSNSIFKCDYLKNNYNNEMKFICINQTQAQYNLTANPT